MSISQSLAQGMNLFDVQPQVITVCLELMTQGTTTTGNVYYQPHPTVPGVNIVFIELVLPSIAKGSVALLPFSSVKHTIPEVTTEIARYTQETFMGYKVYIHPTHLELSSSSLHKVIIGLMLVTRKGCITFTP